VLFSKDPVGQCRLVIVLENRDASLDDDWAGIRSFIHQVDGAARNLHPVLDRLPLGVQSRERRKQGGVDVHHPARELADDLLPQYSHVACEDKEIRLEIPHRGQEFFLVCGL